MKKAGRAPSFSAARPLARRVYTMGNAGTVKVFELVLSEIAPVGQAFPSQTNQIERWWLKRCTGATIFVEKS
jgi:hypothetical protein